MFSRDAAQVVTGHTPHVLFFFLFCPRHAWFIARFGRASLLSRVCRGAILDPGRLGVFGFSLNIGGLEITRPLLKPFLGCEAAWVFIVDSLFVVFVFPLLFCFAAFSRQLEGAGPSSNEAYQRVIEPAPRPSERAPSCAAVWTRPFGILFSLLCVWQRVTGTVFGGRCPLRSLFHRQTCDKTEERALV